MAEGTDPAWTGLTGRRGAVAGFILRSGSPGAAQVHLAGIQPMYFLSSKTRLITGLRTSCR